MAGVVDADGYVSIQRSFKTQRVYYGARVGITGTRREPHDLAAGIFGGNVTATKSRGSRGFVWTRHGVGATTVLNALYPYLRIKRGQADLALELQEEIIPIAPWVGTSMIAHQDDLYAMCALINVRPGGRRPGRSSVEALAELRAAVAA